ncbi:hypothetical protein [Chenggangzhangella methanolivorans]|uniref:Uncharacterized protein n=1 Tax=Chenggangzhangella methanolivorans TaxID=1437009 RepID=A0A9E6R6V6_9HYPH|nr:hypothetical protein [Chenggangzhangella methanolivorans]QZN98914.1 hypothetical protein K6K41_18660 [Chenggangzhangella methanolivorans]
MGANTDDGFIVESQAQPAEEGRAATLMVFLVLASDETEALGLVEADHPGLEHRISSSGPEIKAQAARLGIEPGTYRQI